MKLATTITVTAPPGNLGLELGRSGIVTSVLPYCTLGDSVVGPYDRIVEVNGKKLAGLLAWDIMSIFSSLLNEPKTLIIHRKNRANNRGAANLKHPSHRNVAKRKVLEEIQYNGSNTTTSKKSKIDSWTSPTTSAPTRTTITAETKEKIEPLLQRSFPRVESVVPPRELTENQAKTKVAQLKPLIDAVTNNIKDQEQHVRSLQHNLRSLQAQVKEVQAQNVRSLQQNVRCFHVQIKAVQVQLKEAENQMNSFKYQRIHLERCRDRAQNDVASDATKLLEKAKHVPNPSEEVAKTLMQDMCNVFRSTQTGPTRDMAGTFMLLINHLCTKGGTDGMKGAIRCLLQSIRSQSPIGIEETALKSLYGQFLSDPTIPQVDAPYHTITEAIVQVGSSDDITNLIRSVLATCKTMTETSDRMITNARYSTEGTIPRCPIMDVMQPTLEILKESTKAEFAILEPLRTALKISLIQSLSEMEDHDEPNYSMPSEADIAERAGCKRLSMFLRSPTIRSAQFDLSKSVRIMMICRIIDKQSLPTTSNNRNKKLRHEKKGWGPDRVLVITKLESNKPTTGKAAWQQDRKNQYKHLLQVLKNEDVELVQKNRSRSHICKYFTL